MVVVHTVLILIASGIGGAVAAGILALLANAIFR